MTDDSIKQCAMLLGNIAHHELEIQALESRIRGHREQIAKERERVERLKAGESVDVVVWGRKP